MPGPIAMLVLAAAAPAVAHETVFIDRFDRPDGLITNSCAYWPNCPDPVFDDKWVVVNGSFFADNGWGWTGVPDDAHPDDHSTNGTGSAQFRALTKTTDFLDVAVAFKLVNQELVQSTTTPAEQGDGVRVLLRYQGEDSYYSLEANRRDNRLIIKKRYVSGTGPVEVALSYAASYAVPYSATQAVEAEVTGTSPVRLVLHVGSRQIVTFDDGTVGGPPIAAPGAVGLRGINADFRVDDFVVAYPSGGHDGGGHEPPPGDGGEDVAGSGLFQNVRSFPNPWRADRNAGAPLTFDNLPAGSTVRIFTLSGRFVASVTESAGAALWTLRNNGGEPVGSGFYVYTIEAPGGKTTGRVAIVR